MLPKYKPGYHPSDAELFADRAGITYRPVIPLLADIRLHSPAIAIDFKTAKQHINSMTKLCRNADMCEPEEIIDEVSDFAYVVDSVVSESEEAIAHLEDQVSQLLTLVQELIDINYDNASAEDLEEFAQWKTLNALSK